MFTTVSRDGVPFGAITILRAVNLADAILAGARARLLARQTRKELSRLSDKQLEDIGLSRFDIN